MGGEQASRTHAIGSGIAPPPALSIPGAPSSPHDILAWLQEPERRDLGDFMTFEVVVAEDVLAFAGIAPPTLRLYPIEAKRLRAALEQTFTFRKTPRERGSISPRGIFVGRC